MQPFAANYFEEVVSVTFPEGSYDEERSVTIDWDGNLVWQMEPGGCYTATWHLYTAFTCTYVGCQGIDPDGDYDDCDQ